MMTKIIDGKKIALEIEADFATPLAHLQRQKVTPLVVLISIAPNHSSQLYINSIIKKCARHNIAVKNIKLDATISESSCISIINEFNTAPDVHGIMLQNPLPRHINPYNVYSSISPFKDIDGVTPENTGKLTLGTETLAPCTPQAIITVLKHEKITIEGKNAVVIGRSNIVGKPTALLLLKENATVTLCHSKTDRQDMINICKNADILVSAAGVAEFIGAEYIKHGAAVIDAGINLNKDNKLTGDIHTEGCLGIADIITPVPGGIGPVTVNMLIKNIITAVNLSMQKN